MSSQNGYTKRYRNDLPRKRHRKYRKITRSLQARPVHNVWEDTYSWSLTAPINKQDLHIDGLMDVVDVNTIRDTIMSYQKPQAGLLGQQRTNTFVTSGMRTTYDIHNLSTHPAVIDMYVVAPKDTIWDHRVVLNEAKTAYQVDLTTPSTEWYTNNQIVGSLANTIYNESVNLQCISNIATDEKKVDLRSQINRIGTSLYQISGLKDEFRILRRRTYQVGPGGDLKVGVVTPGVQWDIPGRHHLWNGYNYKTPEEVSQLGQVDQIRSYLYGHLAWRSSRFVVFIVRGSVGKVVDSEIDPGPSGYTQAELAVVTRREVNWSFVQDAYMLRKRTDQDDYTNAVSVQRVRDTTVNKSSTL